MKDNWFYPNTVIQIAEHESHVAWNDENNFFAIKHADLNFITTTKELLHIANSYVNDVKMLTYYLYLTDFRFTDVPAEITTLEAEMKVNRGGRITDNTVQLIYNDVFIGENQADFDLSIVKRFSDWNTPLTKEMLENPSFGIAIRFQSHPMWPHKESPKLDYVRFRVW